MKKRQPLGITHTNGEPLPEGTYHIVVDVWTINANDGRILIALRDPCKECQLCRRQCAAL